MKLIVGLGNPGKRYERTRHNVGFWVIDQLLADEQLSTSVKHKGQIARTLWKGEPVLLFKPDTFMNLSGDAVRLVVEYYQLDLSDVLIIYDDLDLPMAKLRLREKGGAGGHNGLKSLISALKSEQFPRLRIGIDKHEFMDAKDYVLGHLSEAEQQALIAKKAQLLNICHDFTALPFVDVMTKHNSNA
jgi:PTH1 family peptidyl-tRNA hydrolase